MGLTYRKETLMSDLFSYKTDGSFDLYAASMKGLSQVSVLSGLSGEPIRRGQRSGSFNNAPVHTSSWGLVKLNTIFYM